MFFVFRKFPQDKIHGHTKSFIKVISQFLFLLRHFLDLLLGQAGLQHDISRNDAAAFLI